MPDKQQHIDGADNAKPKRAPRNTRPQATGRQGNRTLGAAAPLIGGAVAACALAALLVALPAGLGFGSIAVPPQLLKIESAPAVPEGVDTMHLDAASLKAQAEAAERPEKLAEAEESIDANGIVHGTLDGVAYTVRGRGVAGHDPNKITLTAVGDQIATDNILAVADGYAGEMDDNAYDFDPFYREIGQKVREGDLRFVNQETVMAGLDDGYIYVGYPSFNTPPEAGQALYDQGFNIINFCSNHLYDYDVLGVERTHENVWSQYPQMLIAGSYLSQQARETVQMIERNGTTFAVLAYTYGDNRIGVDPAFVPDTYHSTMFDKKSMAADIARAKKVADCVIVCMHWGVEYESDPSDLQLDYSQWLADQDVDLVIGTHAHTIQPVRYVQGKNGNQLLVIYGLSDLICGWDLTDTLISGLFQCDFVRDEQTGRIVPQNPLWHPLIEWSDGTEHYVRFAENMSKEETNANTRTPDVEDDYTYIRWKTNNTVTDIPVAWPEGEAPIDEQAAAEAAASAQKGEVVGDSSAEAVANPDDAEASTEEADPEAAQEADPEAAEEPARDDAAQADPARDSARDSEA